MVISILSYFVADQRVDLAIDKCLSCRRRSVERCQIRRSSIQGRDSDITVEALNGVWNLHKVSLKSIHFTRYINHLNTGHIKYLYFMCSVFKLHHRFLKGCPLMSEVVITIWIPTFQSGIQMVCLIRGLARTLVRYSDNGLNSEQVKVCY